MEALNEPTTIEVAKNADGTVWQECLGEKMKKIGHMSASRAESVMRTIAAALGTTITRNNPILEVSCRLTAAVLPVNSRLLFYPRHFVSVRRPWPFFPWRITCGTES